MRSAIAFRCLALVGGLLAAVDCGPAPDAPPHGIERFWRVSDGVVGDRETALEWTARDNGAEADWPAAERFCRELRLARASDWRLPTIDELASVFDAHSSSTCGDATCHADAAFELTNPYYWSASQPDRARRFYFDFRFGTRLAPFVRPGLTRRALCVREARAREGNRSGDP